MLLHGAAVRGPHHRLVLGNGALQLAAGFEGHADNVAASLYGGLALAWSEPGPAYHAVGLGRLRDGAGHGSESSEPPASTAADRSCG